MPNHHEEYHLIINSYDSVIHYYVVVGTHICILIISNAG